MLSPYTTSLRNRQALDLGNNVVIEKFQKEGKKDHLKWFDRLLRVTPHSRNIWAVLRATRISMELPPAFFESGENRQGTVKGLIAGWRTSRAKVYANNNLHVTSSAEASCGGRVAFTVSVTNS